jgi:hypothetical protein
VQAQAQTAGEESSKGSSGGRPTDKQHGGSSTIATVSGNDNACASKAQQGVP